MEAMEAAILAAELKKCKVYVFAPESFEWLILASRLFSSDSKIKECLSRPFDFIESAKFFSWERFFTSLLVSSTAGTVRAYNKSMLADYYRNPINVKKVAEMIDCIDQSAESELKEMEYFKR